MSQEEEVSTVGDHNEKMAKRGGRYRSKHEEGGAGDAKEACFQTHKNGRKKKCGGMLARDKRQPKSGRLARPVLNMELVDQLDYGITITQFCIVKIGKVLFLYLNGKPFYKTGRPGAGFWRCKNIWRPCDAYISATTYDTTTAELRLDSCKFKHSEQCIKTELEARQKEKESQLLLHGILSPGEAPESLERLQAFINQTKSTNTLDSKAGEKTKDDVDVPKEIAPLLKNNSLRRITYDFNEIQSSTASNTNNDSNISTITSIFTSFALIISLLLLKFGNIVTTVKKTYYIHNEKYACQSKGAATQINKSQDVTTSVLVTQAAASANAKDP